jgi:DNA-binding GntR family transcriptional regulator
VSDIQAPGSGKEELAYLRVAADIEQRIKSGELAPGARLLSERALAEYYGVAFHTVRHAIAVLRERGLVETVHGRGNFVVGDANQQT